MILIEKTELPDEALPVAALRAHLRLGTGLGDETLQADVLGGFLRAAMAAIEARTGKVLLERQFLLTLEDWRDPVGQPLPVAPVTALNAVVMKDPDGQERSIVPALYRLVPDAQRPLLRPLAALLPMVPTGGGVQIDFSAGLAAAWPGLPADLRQAVLMLAAHYYEYRDDTALGAGCMPFGVSSLIERYRTVRLLGGGVA